MDRRNIVINLSMFTLEQDIYCYIDGECVETKKVSMNDIELTVEQLKKKYQVNKISIVGSADFATPLGNSMQSTFDNCEIEIISR